MPVKVASSDMPVGIGKSQGYTGNSAQASGIANDNAAFGGNQAAIAQTLAVQQYYRDHPELTPQQVAGIVDADTKQANAYYNPDSTLDKVMQGLALTGSIVGVGLLGGAVLAPAVAAAAGGGTAGTIAGGAAAGASTGAFSSALEGQNIGKGALLGAVGGSLASAAAPIQSSISSGIQNATGLGSTASNALAGGLVRGTTGAITGELSGAGAAQGALTGSISGTANAASAGLNLGIPGLGSAVGSVIGHLVNTASSISAGHAPAPSSASNPSATQAAAPSPLGVGVPISATAGQTSPSVVQQIGQQSVPSLPAYSSSNPYTPASSTYNPYGSPSGYLPAQSTNTNSGVPSSYQSFLPAAALGATALGPALSGSNNMAFDPTQAGVGAPSNVTSGVNTGNTILSGLGSVLGTISNANNASANGNVLSLANNGTGVGTNTSFAGPNSYGTIQNGQVASGLTGALSNTNNGLQTFSAQSTAQAANAQNGLPTNVANALQYQTNLTNALPQGTQGQLQQQSNLQNGVQNSQLGLVNAGTTALNNPLTAKYQNAAQTQLNTAGQDFNTTYNNSLSSLNQALALPTAQAESQLADAQFGRGQLGTSGGALQTQAFATGLGQAYLGNQQTAYNEAMNAQNSATTNAANLGNAANSNLNTANGLLSNAFSQFNNTSALNTNTANSIYSQNQAINQLGNQYGQQNLTNQVTAAGLPANYASQYLANANNAVAGTTALNNQSLSGVNAALAAGTQQGNQYNNALSNSARIVAPAYAQTGGNSTGAFGAALTGAAGQNVLGGLASLLNGNSIGGGGTLDSNGMTQLSSSDLASLENGAINSTAPNFDFSNIGNTVYDPTQFDSIWGDGQ